MRDLIDRPAIHVARLMGVLAGLKSTLSNVDADDHEQAHAAIRVALEAIEKAQRKAA